MDNMSDLGSQDSEFDSCLVILFSFSWYKSLKYCVVATE